MRNVVIEIGFDGAAGDLAPALWDEHGPLLKDPKRRLYPLQFGIARRRGASATPLWPTQLRTGDLLRFRLFDIDRRPRPPGRCPEPELLHIYFHDVEEPRRTRQVFTGHPTPIEVPAAAAPADPAAYRLGPCAAERASHVFGAPEREAEVARVFRSWEVSDPRGVECVFELAPKRVGRRLDSALLALALRVRTAGGGRRDYVLDPEVYIGPYVTGPPP